jgi:DNA-binding beta-propeller fold protein YncE
MTGCASESGERPLGPPRVTATFDVGAGPLPDVASDPTTNEAYVTSTGDDSLYVLER